MKDIFLKNPYSVFGNVLSFSNDDFYWELKIPRSKLVLLNNSLDKGGDFYETINSFDIDQIYTIGLQRADFIPMINFVDTIDRPLRILDLGSGFGNITLPLAKRFPDAEIFAADASIDILKILNHRLFSEGVSNVTCVHIPRLEDMDLPFKMESFDLIIMNGVLEWVGAGTNTGNPRKHQENVLIYLKSLLTQTGTIYIGIENRYFFGYFTGVKDPHSGVRFTSVLPRMVANTVTNILNSKPYRTYLYSYNGFLNLFKGSGFPKDYVDTSFIWASYKDPFFISNIKQSNDFKKNLRRFGSQIFPTWRSKLLYVFLSFFNLDIFFAPSFLFFLYKSSSNKTYLAKKYAESLLGMGVKNIIKLPGGTRDDGGIYFLVTSGDDQEWNLKVPRNTKKDVSLITKIDSNFLAGQHNGCSVYMYPFIDGNIANKLKESQILNTMSFLKEKHTQWFKFEIRHGDCTCENIIIDKYNKLNFIDFDDVVSGEPQMFDLCDYFLHISRIYKKLDPRDSFDWLVSPEVLTYINKYDSSLNADSWAMWLQKYLQHKTNNVSNRPTYTAYVRDLFIVLSNKTKN